MALLNAVHESSVPLHESELKTWYKFLKDLQSKFSTYEIQKNSDAFNSFAKVEPGENKKKVQDIYILSTKDYSEYFSPRLQTYNIPGFLDIKSINLKRPQFEELISVLNLTLKNEIIFECKDKNTLVVKGYIVKFSDFLDSNGNLNHRHCSNNVEIDTLIVYAISTVFIDRDLKAIGKQLKLSIAAPKWTVIGKRNINLNGVDAKVHSPPKAIGYHADGAGKDGEPGLPGVSGGRFFGFGVEIIDDQNLTITADGGVGGPGQIGGDGIQGKNTTSIGTDVDLNLCPVKCKSDGTVTLKNNLGIKQSFTCTSVGNINGRKNITISNDEGTFGGRGGNGGVGGNGGWGGGIELKFNKNVRISESIKDGKDGKGGLGGDGGVNGYGPEHVRVTNNRELTDCEIVVLKRGPIKNMNEKGFGGVNTIGLQNAVLTGGIIESDVVYNYKKYLIENIGGNFDNSLLISLIHQFNKMPELDEYTRTTDLINELRTLEEQFHKIYEKVDVLPFYESLLNRIIYYRHNLKPDEKMSKYQRALNYVHTATFSKISTLKDNFDLPNVIINFGDYLTKLKDRMQSVIGLNAAHDEFDLIEKRLAIKTELQADFNATIHQRIVEANNLIRNEIQPEINKINEDIDSKIVSLIGEVKQLQSKNGADQKTLLERQQELQKMLPYKAIFGTMKVVGQAVALFGPVGAAAGGGISIVGTIGDHVVSNKGTDGLPLQTLSYNDQIAAINNLQSQNFKNLLIDISRETHEHPDNLSDLEAKSAVIKEKLDHAGNYTEITELKKQLQTMIKEKVQKLEKDNSSSDKKKAKALASLKKYEKVFEVGSGFVDVLIDLKKDEKSIDAITTAMDEKKEQLEKLKQFEEQILTTVSPILENMKRNFGKIVNQSNITSEAALEVTKWKVQSTLREIQAVLKDITQGFKVQDKLANSIGNLQGAMTTLINVHDRIEQHKQRKEFIDFVANVSIADNALDIDRKLLNDIRYLEVTISSNIILQEYLMAMKAFKQFVFPYAEIYFKSMTPASYFELGIKRNGAELNTLIINIAKQIETLQRKLSYFNSTVNEKGSCIFTGQFHSFAATTEPFYAWNVEQDKTLIDDLFTGKEIVVNVDIKKSPIIDNDAIKFNKLQLDFIAKNETLQAEINKMVEVFQVVFTHQGNSYYRFNNKFYLMETNSVTFRLYPLKFDGEYARYQNQNIKINNGDFMLSPFATWKIQLRNYKNKYNFTLEHLKKYKKDIASIEFGGRAEYIERKEDVPGCYDVEVDKYYKSIDKYEQIRLGVSAKKGNPTASPKKGSSIRKKREIGEKADIVVNEGSQENTPNGNTDDIKFTNRLSWITLPSVKILPAAEDKNVNVIPGIDNYATPFTAGVKFFKDLLSFKISKLNENDSNANTSEQIINNYIDHIIGEDNYNSSISLGIDLDNSKNSSDIQTISAVDVNGNLALSQMVAHKIFGSNKTLNSTYYASPEKQQKNRIIELASKIVPILNDHSSADDNSDNFKKYHDVAPQWYQKLYKDETEKQ